MKTNKLEFCGGKTNIYFGEPTIQTTIRVYF